MLMANVRFSHFIISVSTTNTRWIIPYRQCAALGLELMKSGQGLVRVFFVRRGITLVLGYNEK